MYETHAHICVNIYTGILNTGACTGQSPTLTRALGVCVYIHLHTCRCLHWSKPNAHMLSWRVYIYIYTFTYMQVPALVKAKRSHALLEGIVRDFAHAINLAVVEDIAGVLNVCICIYTYILYMYTYIHT